MGQGKFSSKKVKIYCYQKTDHDVWLRETEIQRAEEQRIADERQAMIDRKNAIKEEKLTGAQRRVRKERSDSKESKQ